MIHEFTKQAKAKGWTNTAIAERWGLKSRQLSNIAANPSQKYQDALNGLPNLKDANGSIIESLHEILKVVRGLKCTQENNDKG
jgi:hypothetical protein